MQLLQLCMCTAAHNDDLEAEQGPVPCRLTNVQLISTAGVAPEDLAHCLECACPGSVQLEGCTSVAAVQLNAVG